MLSVSDILKILDQIPIWKTVSQLPKKVAALEEEVSTLKSRLATLEGEPPIHVGDLCAVCGKRAMRRTKRSKSKGPLGLAGMFDETWTCGSCGEVEEREV